MSIVQTDITTSVKLLFFIEEDGKRIARLFAKEEPPILTAIHTEVLPEGEGKGLAKQLLLAMVEYARKQSLKVVAECPYVLAQFQRRAEEYQDIWKQD
jgi:predicted GNAT family acetyltransferase